TVIGRTAPPTSKGDPAVVFSINAPVVGLMAKAEAVLSFSLPTYTNLPAGSMAIDRGPFPAGNGEPWSVISLRAPLPRLIEKAETLPGTLPSIELRFAT